VNHDTHVRILLHSKSSEIITSELGKSQKPPLVILESVFVSCHHTIHGYTSHTVTHSHFLQPFSNSPTFPGRWPSTGLVAVVGSCVTCHTSTN